MQKDTGIDEPRDVEDISSFDFDTRKNILMHKKQELGKEFAQTKEIKDYIEGAIGERIDDNVQKKRGRQKTAEKAI